MDLPVFGYHPDPIASGSILSCRHCDNKPVYIDTL